MKNPKITVLMPVYNAVDYISEAIESILNQTFTDFEFLIIDDASTDDSLKVIQSYYDPRIKIVRNEANLGITLTLNKGISLANAEFIARMDADDISDKKRLSIQYDLFKNDPSLSLVGSSLKYIDKEGTFIGLLKRNTYELYYNTCFGSYIPHPTVMYKKSDVLDLNKYDPKYEYTEDYELWSRYIEKFKMKMCEIPLISYRLLDTSLSQKNFKTQNKFTIEITKKILLKYGYKLGTYKDNISFFRGVYDEDIQNNPKLYRKLYFQHLKIAFLIIFSNNINNNKKLTKKCALKHIKKNMAYYISNQTFISKILIKITTFIYNSYLELLLWFQ